MRHFVTSININHDHFINNCFVKYLRNNMSLSQGFQALYARLDPRLHETARRQVRAHLAKLEREGRVLRTDAPERYVLR